MSMLKRVPKEMKKSIMIMMIEKKTSDENHALRGLITHLVFRGL